MRVRDNREWWREWTGNAPGTGRDWSWDCRWGLGIAAGKWFAPKSIYWRTMRRCPAQIGCGVLGAAWGSMVILYIWEGDEQSETHPRATQRCVSTRRSSHATLGGTPAFATVPFLGQRQRREYRGRPACVGHTESRRAKHLLGCEASR